MKTGEGQDDACVVKSACRPNDNAGMLVKELRCIGIMLEVTPEILSDPGCALYQAGSPADPDQTKTKQLFIRQGKCPGADAFRDDRGRIVAIVIHEQLITAGFARAQRLPAATENETALDMMTLNSG